MHKYLNRAVRLSRRVLLVGSILLFLGVFVGLFPVKVAALSASALIAFTLWCLMVAAVILTATARLIWQIARGTAGVARRAWRTGKAR